MKLLILDQFSDPGGAQQVLLELLPAIRSRGWSAIVGLPGEGPMFARVRDIGFEAVRVECGPYQSRRRSVADAARFLVATPRLGAQIRRLARGVDLVYVNGPRLLPAVALARPGTPVLFHAHSFLPPGIVRQLAGESLQRAGAWVVGSCEFVAAPWREYAGGRVSMIYNGVAGPLSPQWTGATGTVGCIGRIAPEKGQLEFLRAARIIHQALPACRFVVYGAPLFADRGAARYAQEVHAAAKDLPVELPGWSKDVYEALARTDLLLVPSAPHEATTRVILEAFAAGVPVIAFPSGGIPEVIDDGRTGFLAVSAEEMARLAVELLRDPERIRAVSQAARACWREWFTIIRFHRELLGLIEQLILKKRDESHHRVAR